MRKINLIVLHHSAIEGESPQAKGVEKYHITKWGRPGYHFFFERAGMSFPMQPLEKIAYHAGEYNAHSIGICLAGDFRKQNPTMMQIRTLEGVVTGLQHQFNIPDENIKLHRELRATKCPCIDLRELLFKRRIEALKERQYRARRALRFHRGTLRGSMLKRLIKRITKLLGV